MRAIRRAPVPGGQNGARVNIYVLGAAPIMAMCTQ